MRNVRGRAFGRWDGATKAELDGSDDARQRKMATITPVSTMEGKGSRLEVPDMAA